MFLEAETFFPRGTMIAMRSYFSLTPSSYCYVTQPCLGLCREVIFKNRKELLTTEFERFGFIQNIIYFRIFLLIGFLYCLGIPIAILFLERRHLSARVVTIYSILNDRYDHFSALLDLI